nr:uncharacterized protein LOC131771295 isoform X1 [Pocillopora verrucosa]
MSSLLVHELCSQCLVIKFYPFPVRRLKEGNTSRRPALTAVCLFAHRQPGLQQWNDPILRNKSHSETTRVCMGIFTYERKHAFQESLFTAVSSEPESLDVLPIR